jgi:beta-galactosidase
MYNAHVWVNGKFVGNRPFGYIEFQYDISDFLKPSGDNVIAVRLSPEDLSSRWYPGAGIYRNVWLDIRNPIRVAQWGTVVTTPDVSQTSATIKVETTLEGSTSDGNVTVEYSVVDGQKKQVATFTGEVNSGELVVSADSSISNPNLWDLDSPNLYHLHSTVLVDGKAVDKTTTRFGVRKLEFSKDSFELNGRKVRIQGVCLHHDNGPLGAAIY